MKKTFSVILSLLGVAFVFSSCTVQEEVSPDLFIARFAEEYPAYSLETDGMFYEEERCVLFANDASGARYAVEMTCDGQGRVRKISLACADTDKADGFFSFARDIVSVYAVGEDVGTVVNNLWSGKSFAYHETLRCYYSFSQTEAGFFFSIENKKLSPEKEVGLTLRENDITTEKYG